MGDMMVSPLWICSSFAELYSRYDVNCEYRFYLLYNNSACYELSHLIIYPMTMMTSSNGNIFRVTGHLCGKFTGPGEFHAQRPVTRSFDVFFDLRPNKRLSKQWWGWWFETLSSPLWRHCNAYSSLALRWLHGFPGAREIANMGNKPPKT